MRLRDIGDMTLNQILDYINDLEKQIVDFEKETERLAGVVGDLENEVDNIRSTS